MCVCVCASLDQCPDCQEPLTWSRAPGDETDPEGRCHILKAQGVWAADLLRGPGVSGAWTAALGQSMMFGEL